MKNVCTNCHNQAWVDNFYVQYDGLIELYNEKYAKPGAELYAARQAPPAPGQVRQQARLHLVRALAPRGPARAPRVPR